MPGTGPQRYDGRPAAPVPAQDGDRRAEIEVRAGYRGRRLPAGEDRLHPLEVTGGEDEGTLTSSGFGEEPETTAPEEPLDLADLAG